MSLSLVLWRNILRADNRFLRQSGEFWANVRTISQEVGYTERGRKSIKVPTLTAIKSSYQKLGLSVAHIADAKDKLTPLGKKLINYFEYRAAMLNVVVEPLLMNKNQAEREFSRLHKKLKPQCPLPLNKQKAEKKNYAFLTGIVNMLIEANIGGQPCDYDPRRLTTITHDALPIRTLARRVDGAFPSTVNPSVIWEIKEYYYTTTFGSRVADGVYETLLDGMELQEIETTTGRKVQHILFVDDHYTWWECGRSYLCRIIDMLHMGYVDEVIFGKEVITRLPEIAKTWRKKKQ